ncbi:MAG: PqqD family protein [Pseudomonadota bacterium]
MKYEIGSERVVSKVLDDEAVVINLDDGLYYSMDGVAVAIWCHLTGGGSMEALTTELGQRYPGVGAATDDAAALLASLTEAGLLREATGDGAAQAETEILWPEVYARPELLRYDDVAEMVALDPPLPEMSR